MTARDGSVFMQVPQSKAGSSRQGSQANVQPNQLNNNEVTEKKKFGLPRRSNNDRIFRIDKDRERD